MSIVINKAGEEIAFEIAECYMSPSLRYQLRREKWRTKQAFFTAYENLHEEVFKKPWSLSTANPLYL